MFAVYTVALVVASGTGARILSGNGGATLPQEQESSIGLLMGFAAVAACVYLLAITRQFTTLVHRMMTDVPYFLLIGTFVSGALLFSAQQGATPSAFVGVGRMVGGIALGATGARLLGIDGFLRSARAASLSICALCLGLNIAAPDLARAGYRSDVFVGALGWNSAVGYTASFALVLTLFHRWPDRPSRRWLNRRLVVGLAITLSLFTLVLSQSRTSQAAAIGAVLVGTIGLLRGTGLRIASYLMSAAGGIVAVVAGGKYLLDLTNKDTTFTGRSYLWELAGSAIQDRPFLGYGPQNFWKSSAATEAFLTSEAKINESAHNAVIDLILSGGLLALIPFLLLITRLFQRAFHASDEQNRRSGVLAVAALIAILGLSLSVLFRNGFIPAIFAALTMPATVYRLNVPSAANRAASPKSALRAHEAMVLRDGPDGLREQLIDSGQSLS